MPTVNHTLAISINGTNRTTSVYQDSLYIRTTVANRGDTCSFTVKESASFRPLDWDYVTVAVSGTTVFGGYITRREADAIGPGNGKVTRWQVECRDWAAMLDAVIVDKGYTDSDSDDIIASLFTTYLSSDTSGFSWDASTNITTITSDIDIYFENITLRDALNKLAALCGTQWHVSPEKELYWYDPTAPDDAAFNIDSVSPNGSTSFDVLADSVRYGTDATGIVNQVRVIGGEELNALVTDEFAADGVLETFGPFTEKPGSVFSVTFTNVGGVEQTQMPSQIGYRPGDSLSYDGGDFNTLIDLENRTVTIKKTDGSVPKVGTTVTVRYYKLLPVDVTVDDTGSQGEYGGRVFSQTVYDETLTTTAAATDYAERILSEYADGQETITFEVTEHGLLPGRLITINIPAFDLASTYDGDALLLENRDYLLLENGDHILLERSGEARKFLIQDVTIRAVPTATAGQYMVIATVSAGAYRRSLIDSLAGLSEFAGGSGRPPARSQYGNLSRIANDLGEVIAGRALFTDGGTAAFRWDAYNDHTGAVIGLEDTDGIQEGALYILQDGTVRAKVGKMDGLGTVGTVTPSGWGIWTDNGYFTGALAATSGNIGGWTIADNAIIGAGGTISTGTPPLNSGNPGVYMSTAGIFGYGTLGLTFSLPADPALRPTFSSGTINNTVYEVTTTSVIRTGTAGARVQMDNTGVFGYDSGGNLRFSFDTSTGYLSATNGTFSGTVSASRVSGGTVTGALVTAGTVTGSLVSGGTISGAVFTGGTVTQGTISAATISGGTVTGAVFSGGTVTQGTVSAATISGGTVTGATVSGGTVTGAYVTGGTVSQLGGSVLLGTAGLQFTPPTSYVYGAPNSVKWIQSGTVVGEIALSWINSGTADLRIVAGQTAIGGGKLGAMTLLQENASGSPKSSIVLNTGVIQLNPSSTGYVQFSGNARSDGSGNNRTLGTTSYAFRYLYLKDDSGVDRRVSINSSGVLTVT